MNTYLIIVALLGNLIGGGVIILSALYSLHRGSIWGTVFYVVFGVMILLSLPIYLTASH